MLTFTIIGLALYINFDESRSMAVLGSHADDVNLGNSFNVVLSDPIIDITAPHKDEEHHHQNQEEIVDEGGFPAASVSQSDYSVTPYLMDEGPDFSAAFRELHDFLSQFGDSVSVYYENLETGFVFRHYADRVFFGASATKAPFALYIYQKAERGETNLDTHFTFTEGDYWGGSGFIRHNHEFGDTFSQRRLLHLMISPSDNIATRILRRAHGLNGYRAFIESIGGNTHFIQNITYSYLSADEAGLIMREIYKYLESGGKFSDEFKDNLLRNRYPFIISDYPVASKSGWAENFGGAWHDMAIVFAPSPYILTLLSSRAGNRDDRVVYDTISMFIQDFNDRWFVQTSEDRGVLTLYEHVPEGANLERSID